MGVLVLLSAGDLKVVFSRPGDVIAGCLAQFTVMPLMAGKTVDVDVVAWWFRRQHRQETN